VAQAPPAAFRRAVTPEPHLTQPDRLQPPSTFGQGSRFILGRAAEAGEGYICPADLGAKE
jgi:hypothetical protein